MAISICLSIITLNVKGQNAPIKRHRVSDLIKKKKNDLQYVAYKKLTSNLDWQLVSYMIFFFLFFFEFYFIFKLYIIVLDLPNIKMIPPQEYMCSPSWTLLPPPSDSIPLGRPSAPAPSIQYRASNLDWQLVSYMIFYKFQCHSPKSSHPLPLSQSP